MVDNLLSGWGHASGKKSIFLIECDNRRQADCIEIAARKRSEMSRVNYHHNEPRFPLSTHYVTNKHFTELGGIWTKEL